VVSLPEKSVERSHDASLPRVLGPYRMGRRIGSGAMASVYEARHDQLGKTVALKVLHPHVADESRAVARFLREGRAAARIRHPHAVTVIDAGVGADGSPYLVMELEHGETLASLLRTFGILDSTHAVDLLLPLISAIHHAHSLGIVHRDVKPANILISSDHVGDSVAKITDFGISRLTEAASEHHVTADRGLLGTLAYMAPEQVVAAHEASDAADQYSVGVVLYECLTGRLPFEVDGAMRLAHAILHSPLVPARELNPNLPPELDAVVCRALEKVPGDRFSSMLAFGRALLPFASERVALVSSREFASSTDAPVTRSSSGPRMGPITEDDESRPALVSRPSRKSRKAAGAAGAAATLGMLALVVWAGRHESRVEAHSTIAVTATAPPPTPPPVLEPSPSPPIVATEGPVAATEPPTLTKAPSAPLPAHKVDSHKHSSKIASPSGSVRPSGPAQPSAEDNGAPILD
jgi:serine/threonine-protein kinase